MIFAVVISILSGVTIVLSRTLNAELARNTGPTASALWNYIVGLSSAVVVLAVICAVGGPIILPPNRPPLWVFTGGVLGLTIVFVLNLCVKKISAFYLTLFTFIGQVFTGVALDMLLSGRFSTGNLLGGIAVTIGLAYNLYVDKQAALQSKQQEGAHGTS